MGVAYAAVSLSRAHLRGRHEDGQRRGREDQRPGAPVAARGTSRKRTKHSTRLRIRRLAACDASTSVRHHQSQNFVRQNRCVFNFTCGGFYNILQLFQKLSPFLHIKISKGRKVGNARKVERRGERSVERDPLFSVFLCFLLQTLQVFLLQIANVTWDLPVRMVSVPCL